MVNQKWPSVYALRVCPEKRTEVRGEWLDKPLSVRRELSIANRNWIVLLAFRINEAWFLRLGTLSPTANFHNMTKKHWKNSAYYTKRFYSMLDVCRKDHKSINYTGSREKVYFDVNGKTLTYNVSLKSYHLVCKLMKKAYDDNVDYKFSIAI